MVAAVVAVVVVVVVVPEVERRVCENGQQASN